MAITKPTIGSWPNLIARWKLSGLTQAEFCARRNISLPTFRYHLYKPSRHFGSPRSVAGTNSTDTPLFLPVVCSPAPQPGLVPLPASPIEVILADGLRVAVAPGFDPQTLRRVVDALRQPPC
jgi:hypothetical protein